MNKKITLGLFTLLFMASGVQGLAISKIQESKASKKSTVLFNASINQQAAAGLSEDVTPLDPSNPTPSGYGTYVSPNGTLRCSYYSGGRIYLGGTITDGGANAGNHSIVTGSNGCSGAVIGGLSENTPDLDITLPSIDSKDKTSVVSGSSVSVMQYKLALLGYINVEQITGKFDETTKYAIMDFQKNRGLPEVGTYGPKTEAALDSVLSGVKQFSVITGGKLIFEDVNQKSVGTSSDDDTNPSNPTPSGYGTYVSPNGTLRCSYYSGGRIYLGGTITDGGANAGNHSIVTGSNGCSGAVIGG